MAENSIYQTHDEFTEAVGNYLIGQDCIVVYQNSGGGKGRGQDQRRYTNGTADIIFLIGGKKHPAYFIEVKIPGDRLRSEQKRFQLNADTVCPGSYHVIRPKDFPAKIDKILKGALWAR